jgi:hypothetical protein
MHLPSATFQRWISKLLKFVVQRFDRRNLLAILYGNGAAEIMIGLKNSCAFTAILLCTNDIIKKDKQSNENEGVFLYSISS